MPLASAETLPHRQQIDRDRTRDETVQMLRASMGEIDPSDQAGDTSPLQEPPEPRHQSPEISTGRGER